MNNQLQTALDVEAFLKNSCVHDTQKRLAFQSFLKQLPSNMHAQDFDGQYVSDMLGSLQIIKDNLQADSHTAEFIVFM
jgi:hypothetical protein